MARIHPGRMSTQRARSGMVGHGARYAPGLRGGCQMTDTWEAGERSRRPAVDAGRLWAGGLATALVAALVSVSGILLARSVLDLAIFPPQGAGGWGGASTGRDAFRPARLTL